MEISESGNNNWSIGAGSLDRSAGNAQRLGAVGGALHTKGIVALGCIGGALHTLVNSQLRWACCSYLVSPSTK